jgi:hypothetical protein
MVKPVGPGFRVGLRAFHRSDVMRLSEIVPRQHLDELNTITILEKKFPTRGDMPIICAVYKILVEGIGTVVLQGKVII